MITLTHTAIFFGLNIAAAIVVYFLNKKSKNAPPAPAHKPDVFKELGVTEATKEKHFNLPDSMPEMPQELLNKYKNNKQQKILKAEEEKKAVEDNKVKEINDRAEFEKIKKNYTELKDKQEKEKANKDFFEFDAKNAIIGNEIFKKKEKKKH